MSHLAAGGNAVGAGGGQAVSAGLADGLHTPASVHYGTATQIRTQRAATLDAAYAANPHRFTRRPQPPKLPTIAWINEPPEEVTQSA